MNAKKNWNLGLVTLALYLSAMHGARANDNNPMGYFVTVQPEDSDFSQAGLLGDQSNPRLKTLKCETITQAESFVSLNCTDGTSPDDQDTDTRFEVSNLVAAHPSGVLSLSNGRSRMSVELRCQLEDPNDPFKGVRCS